MIFAGIQILGEFLEQRIKEHFNQLKQKQHELGVNLPQFPKPIFTGSTKTLHSMKAKPGSRTGDSVLLIHFNGAQISDYTFDSVKCQLNFKIYINVQHFTILSNVTDIIMKVHNAPIHIVEHQNVFTEKGYIEPQIHVQNTIISNIQCIDSIEKTTLTTTITDTFKYVINVTFDTYISWPPNLKL